MKINGEIVNIREVVTVELLGQTRAALSLKVSGYPIGLARTYELVYPKPTAPLKATGVTSIRSGPESKPDYDDPKFLAAISEWYHLEKMFIVCTCLIPENGIVFANDFNTLEGLRKIPQEFHDAGFSEGDIGKLMKAISSATNFDQKDVDKAAENFA